MNASRILALKSLLPVGAIALLTSGCDDDTVIPPKLKGLPRGTSQMDVYGRWMQKLDTLGRGQYRMVYLLEYAPAGTEVRTNNKTGAVTQGTLTPLDSAQIATFFSVANNRATLSNPDSTTDVTGRASVSIAPVSGPGGSETLSITIYYTNTFSAPLVDTDTFEVDLRATTAFE